MNAQTIINAARETSNYYRIVNNEERIACAFEAFANAIENEVQKEGLDAERSVCAMEEAIGKHCQSKE